MHVINCISWPPAQLTSTSRYYNPAKKGQIERFLLEIVCEPRERHPKNWSIPLFVLFSRYSLVKGERIIRCELSMQIERRMCLENNISIIKCRLPNAIHMGKTNLQEVMVVVVFVACLCWELSLFAVLAHTTTIECKGIEWCWDLRNIIFFVGKQCDFGKSKGKRRRRGRWGGERRERVGEL